MVISNTMGSRWRTIVLALLAGIAAGVLPLDSRAEDRGASSPRPAFLQKVTYSTERAALGIVVRELGSKVDGGIVLTNGLENLFVGPYTFKKKTLDGIVRRIAKDGKVATKAFGAYYFLYPPAPIYEELNRVTLSGRIDDAFSSIETSAAFSSGMALHNCLALLSHALKTTLVADNSIAAALSGELAVNEAPLQSVLEALIRSARVPNESFRVRSDSDYIFLYSAENRLRKRILANEDTANSVQQAMLRKRVSVTLPTVQYGSSSFEAQQGATPLAEVLEALSIQLGLPVAAEKRLDELPVNPVVMNNVPLRKAMELLIHQWLVPDFVYDLTEQGIYIRYQGEQSR